VGGNLYLSVNEIINEQYVYKIYVMQEGTICLPVVFSGYFDGVGADQRISGHGKRGDRDNLTGCPSSFEFKYSWGKSNSWNNGHFWKRQ
jgi:hypothetical protein